MLIRLLFIARRRWVLLLLIPLVACAAGAAFQPRGKAAGSHSYTSTGYVGVVGPLSNFEVQQAILSLQQGTLHDQAVAKLGDGPDKATIKTKLDEKALVVRIALTATNAEDAQAAAVVYTDTFVTAANAERMQTQDAGVNTARVELETARDAYDAFLVANGPALSAPNPAPSLIADRDDLESDVANAGLAVQRALADRDSATAYKQINVSKATLDVVSKLRLPADLKIRVILALVMGIVGAISLVAFLEKLNPRIDDPAHAERIIGAPVWAMVPVIGRRHAKLLDRVDPATFSGPFAESFRALRSYLDFRGVADEREDPARVIVVSASPGEGKSTTAAFLAYSYAEVDRNVMVVGGDLRRPTIHELFDTERTPGLTSLRMVGGEMPALSTVVRRDPVTGVSIIPSGPSVDRVTGLLTQLGAITRAAQRAGCPVIVDSAPVMVANDPIDFLPCVDWVVVVVRVGRSTERSVKRMISALRLADAEIVGCVMVGSMESSDAKRYYYNYYSPEAVASEKRSKRKDKKARRAREHDAFHPEPSEPIVLTDDGRDRLGRKRGAEQDLDLDRDRDYTTTD